MTTFETDNLRYTLQGKKILLGITGSIAAFKACDIVRFLKACGAEVHVVLTQGAEHFVTKTTLETLSGAPVATDFWSSSDTHGTHHIDTARWADLILIAPATANFIGKVANGLADDLITTEILAFQGPLLIAPAMNPNMYAHPAVQENVTRLTSRGVRILGPTVGVTSCGEEGLGRMLEPGEIVEKVAAAFYPGAPQGQHTQKHLLITLGPTRSNLDPVRFLSNRSSGLMGASLCWAALQAGYRVTAVCGPTQARLPTGMEVIRIQTASEMATAVQSCWPLADIFVSCAAVLDWEVKSPSPRKLKKEAGTPSLVLEKSTDILRWVCQNKTKSQFVLGFAAETEDPIPNALKKVKEKGCDAIFVNDVSLPNLGLESENNAGWWVNASGKVTSLETAPKSELARHLIQLLQTKRG